jgi:hypothetical protein
VEGVKDGISVVVVDADEFVGACDGLLDGAVDGEPVGCNDCDGTIVESVNGAVEGIAVEFVDGFTIGAIIGTRDGLFDGLIVIDGIFDGVSVGEGDEVADMIAILCDYYFTGLI